MSLLLKNYRWALQFENFIFYIKLFPWVLNVFVIFVAFRLNIFCHHIYRIIVYKQGPIPGA